MEGNIVSLTQHNYYGGHLQNYTDMAYIELLAFPVGMGGKGGRKRSWNSKVLGTTVEYCSCIQLGNDKYG